MLQEGNVCLHLSFIVRKPVFGVSDQVGHKPYCHRRWLRGLKLRIKEEEGLYYEAKTKKLIICAVTVQLICAFVFAYMQKAGFLMTWLIL